MSGAKVCCQEVFSSPEPWASGEHRMVASVVCHHTSSKDSSETTGPISIKFHMQLPGNGGKKVYIFGLGHLTKMATMPIYGKNVKKSSFPEPMGQLP